MATRRPFRLLAGFTAALLLVVGGATASFADQLVIGDGVTPLNSGGAVTVAACKEKPVQFNVLIAALREGQLNANAFKNGAEVTVSFSSSTIGATAILVDTKIQIPGDWESLDFSPPKAGSDTVTAVVTLPAKSAAGSGTVSFSFSGTSYTNGTRSGTSSVAVNWGTPQLCDTIAPTLQLPTPAPVEATSAAGAVVTYAASATDTAPLNPLVNCAPASGATFAIGTTTVLCSATDTAGNKAEGSFSVTVQDTTAPAVGPMGNLEFEAAGPLTTVSWTANPSATDAVDGTLATTCAPASGSGFPVGETTVTCSATDAHGNTGSASFKVKVTDTTKPILVLPADDTLQATGPGGAPVAFTATASDLADGPRTVTCSPASGSTFAMGSTTVNCSATDASGNTATGSFTITVVDTVAPVVTVPGPITKEATGPDGAIASFTASASDIVDGASAATCSPASGSVFALGTTTVTCTATDDASNTGSNTFSVSVVDTTAPEITVPGPIKAEATGPDGALVTYTATATDLVDASVTPVCTPASGSTFAIGSVQVDCTATDDTGNTTELPVSFVVTVVDTSGPAITVPEPITVEATDENGAAASYTVTATDLVDGARTTSCEPASGSTFALGETVVSCSAMDATGNENSATFTVTVVDTTAPAITVPELEPAEATGPAGAAVSYTASATDLVDGAVTPGCTPVSGSTFGLGNTTVTCTATDAAGNIGTGTFTVTVVDTTPPVVSVPASFTTEATGPLGAAATYTATAEDLVDGELTATCEPASGWVFPLGNAGVLCTATDAAGNTGSNGFTVTVSDTTAPAVTVPASFSAEATGPTGAVVTYTASAMDVVDGSVTPECVPPSGTTFSLGYKDVTCTATDAAGNAGSGEFTVTVIDTTAPALTVPTTPITAEATGANGAVVTYTATAEDLVDGSVTPECLLASGSTFALGQTTVTCTATDARDNKSSATFTVTVVDTTAPTITTPTSITAEATGASGAAVSYSATAWDVVDGAVTPSCTPLSGSTFALGNTTVACIATDAAGNTDTKTFSVTVVDTTPPVISWVGGPTGGSYVFGSVPLVGTCTAEDVVSGSLPCTVNGYGVNTGPHTMIATATDAAGNTGSATRTYSVAKWTLGGFFQPVDMNGIWNGVKGGSTVPLKFEVFAGSTELTNTSAIDGFVVKGVACPGASAATDDIELTTTGGTSLRYDTTAGQFIQNWQTPKKPGACYEVTMKTQDGSTLSALFKLK